MHGCTTGTDGKTQHMMAMRKRYPRQTKTGFTLIELVIVITILGILAVIALPKFIAIQADARVAKLNSARGAVAAGAVIVHSAYLARGGITDQETCPAGGGFATNLIGGTLCTEGGLLNLVNGYPASAALGVAGIISEAGLSSADFVPTLAQLNLDGIGATVAGAITTISVIGGSSTVGGAGAKTNASCSFTYTDPVSAGAAAEISAVTTTGC